MTQSREPTIRQRVQGCLAGLAIGDALGMPVEIMSREEILEATDGNGVTGLLDNIQRKIEDTREFRAGMTTDDTQLAFVVAEALLEHDGFDLEIQARRFVNAYRRTTFGWGRTTTKAAKDIARYFDTDGKEGRAPDFPAPEPEKPGAACGNGVAMKIAPLAIWHALSSPNGPEPLLTEVMELGLQTHGDPRASFAAVAVAATIRWIIRHRMETERLCPLRDHTLEQIDIVETRYRSYRYTSDQVSGRLRTAFAFLGDPKILRECVGTGCFSLESIPFAIAMFHRNPLDFRAGVLEAVNAGGDTDTTAAMVGAMVGAHVGIDGIPKEWLDAVPSVREAIAIADRIYDALDADTVMPFSSRCHGA